MLLLKYHGSWSRPEFPKKPLLDLDPQHHGGLCWIALKSLQCTENDLFTRKGTYCDPKVYLLCETINVSKIISFFAIFAVRKSSNYFLTWRNIFCERPKSAILTTWLRSMRQFRVARSRCTNFRSAVHVSGKHYILTPVILNKFHSIYINSIIYNITAKVF